MKFVKFALAAVAALFISQAADAQLYLTGGFNMSQTSSEKDVNGYEIENPKTNRISIAPEVGYYFADGLAFGAEVSLAHTKYEASDAYNRMNFNPFFRWDFISGKDFNLGLKARFLLGFGKNKHDNGDVTAKVSNIGVSIVPVAQYNFNSHWGMFGTFGDVYYRHNVNKNPDNKNLKTKSNSMGISADLTSLYLGIVYTF